MSETDFSGAQDCGAARETAETSEPHTIVVQVYFAQREGGAIRDVPVNAQTRPALADSREIEPNLWHANAATSEALWNAALPYRTP